MIFFSKMNSFNNQSIKFISSLQAASELVERQKIPVSTLPSQKGYITSLAFFELILCKGRGYCNWTLWPQL